MQFMQTDDEKSLSSLYSIICDDSVCCPILNLY